MWTPIEQGLTTLVNYAGRLPSKLYRYRSITPQNLDRLIDFEIIEEGIFLAGLKDLNDPDEGRFLISFDGNREQIASYWKDAIASHDPSSDAAEIEKNAYDRADEILASRGRLPKHVIEYTRYALGHLCRVACFTTLPTNYSMWAHYAKCIDETNCSTDHGGICIEYTCNENWRSLNLHPVIYSDQVPKVNPCIEEERGYVNAIYTKSSEWRGEEEWRIFQMIQCTPPFPSNLTANSKIRVEGGISGIIFGLKTPDQIIAEISARVKSTKRSISLRQVALDPTTYKRVLIDITSAG